MAIEAKERRIGASHYRITQLPAKRGRAMLVRFVRLLGPGAGAFVGGLGRGKASLDAALGIGIADGLHDLCTRLNDEDLSAICDEFATYTVVIQSRDIELQLSKVFDDHFAGRYDEMLAWLRACCEVNFSSFFGASSVGDPLAKLMQVLSKWQPQPASTGTSTVSPPPVDMQTTS
jgi:hypothetical protein